MSLVLDLQTFSKRVPSVTAGLLKTPILIPFGAVKSFETGSGDGCMTNAMSA